MPLVVGWKIWEMGWKKKEYLSRLGAIQRLRLALLGAAEEAGRMGFSPN
jgi:hypothetical protein